MRLKDPDRPRPFRVPFGPWILPLLGVASSLFLMFYLPPQSWWRFFGWLGIGLSIYILYGYSHSAVGMQTEGKRVLPLYLRIFGLVLLLITSALFIRDLIDLK
jgi:basic amino acid/polyamine antiporter, APA family